MVGDITYRNVKLNDQPYFDHLMESGKIPFKQWYDQVSEYTGQIVQVVSSFPETDEYRVILKGERVLLSSADFVLLPEEN